MLEELKTLRSQLMARLSEVMTAPKPSYTIGGPDGSQTVNWNEYTRILMQQIEDVQKLIVALDPYNITTRIVV